MIKLSKIKRLHRRFFARHRFLLHLEAVFVWLFIVALFFYAISLFVIPSVVERNLEKRCGGTVDVRFGRFKGLGAIRLSGVVVAQNEPSLLKDPILRTDQVDIQFDLWKLLGGRFRIHTVTLSDSLLTIDYDASSKAWNLGSLSYQKTKTSGRNIPLFQIQRGTVRFRQKKEDGMEILAIVGIAGQIAAPVEKNEYSFMLETDGRYGFGESKIQGGFRIADERDQSNLFATGYINMPEAGILKNKWDIKDIRLEAAFDEKTIDIKQFQFSMGNGNGHLDGVIHRAKNFPMKLNISLHGLTLSDQYKAQSVCYHWLIEESDSGFARFLRRFRPEGAGELDLSINAELDNLSQTKLDGLILCKDISICDEKFPYRIEKMKGGIEFEGRTIRMKQIQSRHGDVHLQLDGQISDPGAKSSIDFRVTSQNMSFNEELFQALPENVKKVWYDYTPHGLAAIDYHFWKTSEGEKQKELTVELKDMAVTYKYFPYIMEGITGKIVFGPQKLLIEDVLADIEDRGQVIVNGRILQQEGAEQEFDVTVRGDRIPINEKLVKAMPTTYADFWKHFDLKLLKGYSDFKISVLPDETDSQFLDYAAQVKIYGDAFLYDDFPISMDNVDLNAYVTEDLVQLDSFSAQSGNGPIQIGKSRLWSQGADPNLPAAYLTLDLKDFDLNDTFWDSVGPHLLKKLGHFSLRGPIASTGKLAMNVPNGEQGENDLIICCDDNSFLWGDSTLGTVNGCFHVANDRISFSEFDILDISLNSLPEELLSSKAEHILAGVNPKGQIDVHIDDGFVGGDSGKTGAIDVHAKITTDELSFGTKEVVSKLKGDCQGYLSIDFETGNWQTSWHYNMEQFRFYDRLVKSLVGDLVFDPNTIQLKSDRFLADVCDGKVTGNLEISLMPDEVPQYQLQLNYDGVDVQKFSVSEINKTPSPEISKGLASGRLGLEGALNDIAGSRGTFQTKLEDLKMGHQSLLGKILTAVQFKQPENFVFNEIEMKAEVLGPELIFNQIRMVGSPLIFYGSGKMNLQDRSVKMELASWDRNLDTEETMLEALARGIGSALWKIEIEGTLDAPKVEAVYLSVLKQPLNIFKKSKAD